MKWFRDLFNRKRAPIQRESNRPSEYWLEERWNYFNELGPEAILPTFYGFFGGSDGDPEVGLYAGLFPSDGFVDLKDFLVYQWVNGSSMQHVLRMGKPDLDWHVTLPANEEVPRLSSYLKASRVVSGPIPASSLIRDFSHQSNLEWVENINLESAIVDHNDSGFNVVGKSGSGYFVAFLADAVTDPTEEDVPRPSSDEVIARCHVLHLVVSHALSSPPKSMLDSLATNWTVAERKAFEKETNKRCDAFIKIATERGLWRHFSPAEREFAHTTPLAMTMQQQINFSWRVEALQVLMWSLGILDEVPPMGSRADHDLLARLSKVDEQLTLRSVMDINAARDLAELWHWRSRTRQLSEEGRSLEPSPEMLEADIHCFDDVVRETARAVMREKGGPLIVEEDFSVNGKAYRDLDDNEWAEVRSITMERHFALNWLCGYAPMNRWDETPTDT